MLDARGRRRRDAPPKQRDSDHRIDIGEGDLEMFRVIHRHGHLPSNYLNAFYPISKPKFLNRLTKLANGADNGRFLVKPAEQFETKNSHCHHLVYDLAPAAKNLITLSPYINRRDHFVHRLMGACIGASLQLSLKERFISRHGLLSVKGNPMKLPLKHGHLVPDELFAISFGDKKRAFACEWDRATEPIERTTDGTDFVRKLDGYIEVMRNDTPREVWGVGKLHVFIVTPAEARNDSIRKAIHQRAPELTHRFHFDTVPCFQTPWSIPPILDLAITKTAP